MRKKINIFLVFLISLFSLSFIFLNQALATDQVYTCSSSTYNYATGNWDRVSYSGPIPTAFVNSLADREDACPQWLRLDNTSRDYWNSFGNTATTFERAKQQWGIVPYPTGACVFSGHICHNAITADQFIPGISLGQCLSPDSNNTVYTDAGYPCQYTVCDMIQLFINASNFVIKVIGGIVLIFLLYASIMFIIAQGSSDKIEKGKKMIRAAITGLIIVLFSYQLIGIILTTVLRGSIFESPGTIRMGTVLSSPWDTLAEMRRDCGVKPTSLTPAQIQNSSGQALRGSS